MGVMAAWPDRPALIRAQVAAALTSLGRSATAVERSLRPYDSQPVQALSSYIRRCLPDGWRVWVGRRRVWALSPTGHRVAIPLPAPVQVVLGHRGAKPKEVASLRVLRAG